MGEKTEAGPRKEKVHGKRDMERLDLPGKPGLLSRAAHRPTEDIF